ncbi:hypothetical protein LTS18_002060, partial [Coniosporium uncinatum]
MSHSGYPGNSWPPVSNYMQAPLLNGEESGFLNSFFDEIPFDSDPTLNPPTLPQTQHDFLFEPPPSVREVRAEHASPTPVPPQQHSNQYAALGGIEASHGQHDVFATASSHHVPPAASSQNYMPSAGMAGGHGNAIFNQGHNAGDNLFGTAGWDDLMGQNHGTSADIMDAAYMLMGPRASSTHQQQQQFSMPPPHSATSAHANFDDTFSSHSPHPSAFPSGAESYHPAEPTPTATPPGLSNSTNTPQVVFGLRPMTEESDSTNSHHQD